MTESQLVTACLEWLKLRRVVHWRANQIPVPGRAFRGTRGVSDILAICPGGQGRILCIECKVGKNDLSADQEKWLADVSAAGGLTIVVRDVADLENLWKEMGW